MAITHFMVTRLPDTRTVVSKVGIDPLEEGVLYPIADQANVTFDRIPALAGLCVFEVGKYKTFDEVEGVYGNEADINLAWKAADGVIPGSANHRIVMTNGASQDLLSMLPLNSAVEYIVIDAVQGQGDLKINGRIVVAGDRIDTSDLLFATYTTESSGYADPYCSISYKVGRDDVLQSTIYTTEVAIEGGGETEYAQESTVWGTIEDDGFTKTRSSTTQTMVIKGPSMGSVTIKYVNEFTYTNLVDPNTAVIQVGTTTVTINGMEYPMVNDSTIEKTVLLNELGEAYISIRQDVSVDKDHQAELKCTGTMLSVNGDPTLVNIDPAKNEIFVQSLLSY